MDSLKAKNAQDIFGLNMKANVFPDVLKKAIVVPIHKKGSPNYPENYRPISLLLMISKIFKKCMALQLVRLFEGIELFSPRQFGFPQGKDAVMGILDHGSILDPIFFLVYVDDLPSSDANEHFTLYADDTTISFVGDTLECACVGSMSAQGRAEEWFGSNRLLWGPHIDRVDKRLTRGVYVLRSLLSLCFSSCFENGLGTFVGCQ
ncbi:hypothetical protein D910_06040 [Dendroctonus ponderosae]|uniref:Reverse transcriptase domain-containing protein n=1 Tax=Dendroctonus ponderosae TaxID=77166 RepID=U4UDI0_DENPD|nr:hypothetical protein D910_06040 [Dendroctonus ponderosae]